MSENTVQLDASARKLLDLLKQFIGTRQRKAIFDLCEGEEGTLFLQKLCEYAERFATMPATHEQEGKGVKAVAHLHYFLGGWDWYITEKDIDHDGKGQIQAFGLVRNQYGGELGYIDLREVLRCGAELDLHFEPKTLEALGHELGQ